MNIVVGVRQAKTFPVSEIVKIELEPVKALSVEGERHALAEKEAELEHAPFGVVGLETAVGVLLTELVSRAGLPLSTVIAALTQRPASVLGLEGGTLKVGSAADLVLLDTRMEWTVEANSFASKGVNSPFLGWRLKGRVTDVVVKGILKLKNMEFVNGGSS